MNILKLKNADNFIRFKMITNDSHEFQFNKNDDSFDLEHS